MENYKEQLEKFETHLNKEYSVDGNESASAYAVAQTLGITVDMVNEAIKAGCSTYEEIKDHFDLR